MSSKKLFELHKSKARYRGLTKGNIEQFTQKAESKHYVEQYVREKDEFIPDIDYSDPKNFVKFGLATKYYENAIKRIYNQYPYDGSLAEKLLFYNDLTPLEKYIYDHLYPKFTGFVYLGGLTASEYDAASVLSNKKFGKTDTLQYITFNGGPNKNNIYDADVGQDSNLQMDFNVGNTVEFWMKKNAFAGAASPKEVIFDLSNFNTDLDELETDQRDANSNPKYGRLTLFLTGSGTGFAKNKLFAHVASGSEWAADGAGSYFAFDTKLTTIADSKWHHYAVVLKNTGSSNDDAFGKLYVDNTCVSELTKAEKAIQAVTGCMHANIGALYGRFTNDAAGAGEVSSIGFGKLSASIDEFRFWKTARTSEEIGRNYFAPIGGGTNTDSVKYYYTSSLRNNPVDLGVYYKFNEGVVGTASFDSIVLDYSGRASNGTFVGYASNLRTTGSAFVLSDTVKTEKPEPTIYSQHTDVVNLKNNLQISGSSYDALNNGSLYNTLPLWIRMDDEVSNEAEKLLQILASYLDTLYGQISEINKLKEPRYAKNYASSSISSPSSKPTAFASKLLNSLGFDTPEFFVDASVLKSIFAQDEKRVYEEKIQDLKNLMYQNIYNNLVYINKSKGTEKAFRNLFRCFGIDNEVFKINIYGDDVEYTFNTSSYWSTATKKSVIDFSGISDSSHREATIYQFKKEAAHHHGYITSSANGYMPFTAEAEIVFPNYRNLTGSVLNTITTASLFGCHKALEDASSLTADTSTGPVGGRRDTGFQVYAIKGAGGASHEYGNVYFQLSSSWFGSLTSSAFPNTGSNARAYDGSKWNFAVRIKKNNYPYVSQFATSSKKLPELKLNIDGNTDSWIEFYGVNTYLGNVVGEFYVTGALTGAQGHASTYIDTAGHFLTASNKRFYVGAHRENFTGDVLQKSDVKFSSLRVWNDYLTNDEIQYHARDPRNFGRTNPYKNSFVYESEANKRYARSEDMLQCTANTDGKYVEFTIPASFGGLESAVRLIIKTTLGSPSAQQIHVKLQGSTNATLVKVAEAINGFGDTTNIKYGSSLSAKKGIPGIYTVSGSGATKRTVVATNPGWAGPPKDSAFGDSIIKIAGGDATLFAKNVLEGGHFAANKPSNASSVPRSNIYWPKIETLLLNWDFESITGSAPGAGTFWVDSVATASVYQRTRYGVHSHARTGSALAASGSYTGKGYGFVANSSDVYDIEFIQTARQQLPENIHSSDMINILERDDTYFTRETRPQKHFFSIEASAYGIVSENILNFFASIDEFNNYIGDPIHMYRDRYKGVEKLRQLFFEKIQVNPDIDKYVSLYKWVDGALDSAVANLMPASANSSNEVRSIVESHILERNKYRWKYPAFRTWNPEAPVPGRKDRSCRPRDAVRDVYRTKTISTCEQKAAAATNPPIDLWNPSQTDVEYIQRHCPSYDGGAPGSETVTSGKPAAQARPERKCGCPERIINKKVNPVKGDTTGADTLNTDSAEDPEGPSGFEEGLIYSGENESGLGTQQTTFNTNELDCPEPPKINNDPDLIAPPVINNPTCAEQYVQSMGYNLQHIETQPGSNEYIQIQTKCPQWNSDSGDSDTDLGGLASPLPGSPRSQSKNPFYWKMLAERDDPELLASGKRGVNSTRVQLHYNMNADYIRSMGKPYFFSSRKRQTIHGGSNVRNLRNKNIDYYRGTFKESDRAANIVLAGGWSAKDGIYAAISSSRNPVVLNLKNEKYFDVDFAIKFKRRVPLICYDGKDQGMWWAEHGNTTSSDIPRMYGQERLPFSVYSSSVESGYQADYFGNPNAATLGPSTITGRRPVIDQNFAIENIHDDVYGPHYEVPMQGLFTEEHVGGKQSRHGQLLYTGSIVEKKEAYRINVDATRNIISLHNPRFINNTTYKKDRPYSIYFRDEIAKRPVNIKNVRSSQYSLAKGATNPTQVGKIGNYKNIYEIVSTTDRSVNNRHIVRNGIPTTSSVDSAYFSSSPFSVAVKEFAFLDRTGSIGTGSHKHIIVSKFSNRSGPAVEGEGYLDIESAQYSVYNALPYSNLNVRFGLNELYKRHCGPQGFDSFHETDTEAFYDKATGSFHKVQRNTIRRANTEEIVQKDRAGIITSTTSFENSYDNKWVSHQIPRTDLQYSWIRDASVLNFGDAPSGSDGLQVSSALQDTSSVTSLALQPLYGFNYPQTGSLLFVSASEEEVQTATAVVQVDFVQGNYIVAPSIDEASNLLKDSSNSALGDNLFRPNAPTAAKTAQGKIILNKYLNNLNGPYGYPSWKQIRTGEHPVARHLKNSNFYESGKPQAMPKAAFTITRLTQSAVTAKHKPVVQEVEDGTIVKYGFGNNQHFFGKTYDSVSNRINDFNSEFDVDPNEPYDTSLLEQARGYVRYSEVVWPKDENVFRKKARAKEFYELGWDDDVGTRIKKHTSDSAMGTQGNLYFGSSWPMDTEQSWPGTTRDNSGELMQIDNCDQATRVYNACHVPTGSNMYVFPRYGRNLGNCRPFSLVHKQAGTGAWYNSYDEYSKEIKLLGQDYSIIPEFTISQFIRSVGTSSVATITHEAAFDFFQNIYELEITGTNPRNEFTREEFLEAYSHSDEMDHITTFKENLGEPQAISLKFDGILKLRPKKGFYPVERTLQLAQEFSRSFAPNTTTKGTQRTWRTALSPFYAPGIMYNSIKSGIAVDYPIVDRETSGALGANRHEYRPVYGDHTYKKKLPFESIIEPSFYMLRTRGIMAGEGAADDEYDVVGGKALEVLYDYDPELPLDSTASIFGTDGVYELAAHNFFAEVPEFFLEKRGPTSFRQASSVKETGVSKIVEVTDGGSHLTRIVSKPEEQWNFGGEKNIVFTAGGIERVRKWSMDVILRKSDNFTMHDNPNYFGHWPHIHHLPPYYTLGNSANELLGPSARVGRTNAGGALTETKLYCPNLSSSPAIFLTGAITHNANKAGVRIVFDPQKIADEDPVKFRSGKFTLDDIMANSSVDYINLHIETIWRGIHEQSGSGFMRLTSSMNLFNKTPNNQWSIGTKWETPVLNFANVEAKHSSSLEDSHTGTHQEAGIVAGAKAFRGMWHQYGAIPQTGSGLFLNVLPSEFSLNEKELTGSLADACGFSIKSERIGEIAKKKIIYEGICAIPFVTTLDGEERFFNIPLEQYERYYKAIQNDEAVTNSIMDMIYKMQKYVIPPNWDFTKFRKINNKPILTPPDYRPVKSPFAMYILEMRSQLNTTDLQKVWQGVLPDIGVIAEKQQTTIDHPIKDGELISPKILHNMGFKGKLPEDIRWKMFKIKKRAANNYFEMYENNIGDRVGPAPAKESFHFTFNWPYDYFSLVETGKLEVSLEFHSGSIATSTPLTSPALAPEE